VDRSPTSLRKRTGNREQGTEKRKFLSSDWYFLPRLAKLTKLNLPIKTILNNCCGKENTTYR
jgi:hypothetical protein